MCAGEGRRRTCRRVTGPAYNTDVVTAEIIAIGNELLLGQVLDTNSNYLCSAVTRMGGRVNHIAVVGDDSAAIVSEITSSRGRGAQVIFTCGGLGPTADDCTLIAVADAIGTQLALQPEAKEFVTQRYQGLAAAGYVQSAELVEARLKMAWLPEGAEMIENPVGAAPGVVVRQGGSRIVSLPGVPSELKAIVDGPLSGLLAGVFGGGYGERSLLVDCGDESKLAPILQLAAAAHPDVYIKSRARHFGPQVRFLIVVSASGTSAGDSNRKVQEAERDLIKALETAGYPSSPMSVPE
ncbi:MAG TPA: molybdopterin-binding protein [Blastocatellia bacterium]|nr:molybdopterin-binding protein [Blastocatellia bacterium]